MLCCGQIWANPDSPHGGYMKYNVTHYFYWLRVYDP